MSQVSHPIVGAQSRKADLRTPPDPPSAPPALKIYNFDVEVERIVTALDLTGGRMTLRCALQEAYAAGYAAPSAPTVPVMNDHDAPDEMLPNGVNLRVIRQAYDFSITAHGSIEGLTAGDHGFEPTGIVINRADLDTFADVEWLAWARQPEYTGPFVRSAPPVPGEPLVGTRWKAKDRIEREVVIVAIDGIKVSYRNAATNRLAVSRMGQFKLRYRQLAASRQPEGTP